MQSILDAIMCSLAWVGLAVVQFFTDSFEFFADLGVYLFDAAGAIVVGTFTSMDWTWLLDLGSYWYALPPEAANVIHVVSAIGLHQAFGIIVAAYVVRFGLQLIPFVRLGS